MREANDQRPGASLRGTVGHNLVSAVRKNIDGKEATRQRRIVNRSAVVRHILLRPAVHQCNSDGTEGRYASDGSGIGREGDAAGRHRGEH